MGFSFTDRACWSQRTHFWEIQEDSQGCGLNDKEEETGRKVGPGRGWEEAMEEGERRKKGVGEPWNRERTSESLEAGDFPVGPLLGGSSVNPSVSTP